MVDEAHGDSKATVNTAKAQTILQQYQQARQSDKPSQPQQTSAYSGVKGYDPSQPANSAYNRTILSYNSAGVNYDIISGGKDTAPTTSQAASVFGTAKPDPQLQQAQAKGYQDVQVFDKSGTVIATVPIGSANDKLNTLANQYGEISYKPVNQKSVNPEEEQMVLQSLKENPQMLGKVITAKGSYLNSLVAQGVLTSEDIDKINQISTLYSSQVQAQNAKARQANIQASLKTQSGIKTNLEAAQKAGASSVDIINADNKVVGTVSLNNLGQAYLQTVKLVARKQGTALNYKGVTTQTTTGVETTLTTPTFREDPLSLFVRPIAALGSSIVLPIWEAVTTGKIQPSPGLSLFQGNIGLSPEVSSKVENLTGFGEEAQKAASNQYKGIGEAAALAGIVTSVAIPTIAGMSGLGRATKLSGRITPEQEIQVLKVQNVKTSTGLFGPEGVQTRSTAKFGEGGVGSTTTGLDSGGASSSITPKGIINTPTKATGVFGETKTTGKGTTGVFQGEIKERITTSTPDLGGKLEYISGTSGEKGNIEKGTKTTTSPKSGLTTLEKIKTTKPTTLTKTTSDILSSENRQLTKTVSRTDLEKQSPQLRQDAFGTVTRTGGRLISKTRQEEETTYLTTPRTGTRIIPLSKTESIQTQNYKNQLSQLTHQTKEKNINKTTPFIVTYKTTPVSLTTPINITTQKSKQVQVPLQSIREDYGTGTPLLGKPPEPDVTRRFGGLIPGFGMTPGALGRVSKSGSRKVYTGNVPFESIVGIYKRGEVTYGNVKNPKPKKLSSNGKNLKFR